MSRARYDAMRLLAVLAALWVGSMPAVGAAALGDANNDGVVTSDDAEMIADFAFGTIGSVTNVANADVNRDGLVDMRDALAIGQAGVKPLILFTYPSSNDVVVNDSTVVVQGTVLVHSLLTLSSFTVNGTAVAVNNGSFSHQIPLTGGQNTITAVATEGTTGTTAQRDVRMHYLKVTNLSTERGRPGESVTINGAGFDPTAGKMFVFFYPGRPATITNVTATSIQVTIPNDVGTNVPGKDGITVVRKAKNNALVPIKQPKPFYPRRHEQIRNHAIDPDSTKTEPECTAAGGTMVGGFCIRRIAMRPDYDATGGLGGTASATPPVDVTSTPSPVTAQAGANPGLATIDLDTGWFYAERFYASDPLVSGAFPLLVGVLAADFTRVPTGSASFDVTTILDNRNPAPLIYLQNPVDGSQTQLSQVLVYGSVNNSSVVVENLTKGLSYTVGTNVTYFQQMVPLDVGANVIRVTATDSQMRTAQQQVTVTRVPLVTIKYNIKDPEPQVTAGGADPDPAKKNATGINLASLAVLLNGTAVPNSSMTFKDNELGGVAFDPTDLSTKRYDITIEFKPGINELVNGSNSTSAQCRDNAGNQMVAPEVKTFDASY